MGFWSSAGRWASVPLKSYEYVYSQPIQIIKGVAEGKSAVEIKEGLPFTDPWAVYDNEKDKHDDFKYEAEKAKDSVGDWVDKYKFLILGGFILIVVLMAAPNLFAAKKLAGQ